MCDGKNGVQLEALLKTYFLQKNYTERDIMAMLPDKRMTLDIMVITKLLSSRGTNSLGNFEMQYLYDPVGVKAAEE